MRQALHAAQAELVNLLPYSPGLNPIEQVFGKLRGLLQSAGERSISGLWRCIGQRVDAFKPDESRNDIQNAGCRYEHS